MKIAGNEGKERKERKNKDKVVYCIVLKQNGKTWYG